MPIQIISRVYFIKPRAYRCNIVGQHRAELPTLLDVTCCVRLHTLSVACCRDRVLLGTDATTPNIVGPTMLRVNVFACFCT